MKIVLGICGFGYGHSIRQRPIYEGLLARGHSVVIIANDSSYQFYTTHYPKAIVARVYVPAMHTTPNGLDFAATANDPRNQQLEANAAFWNACGLIERTFGVPDLVISDYDMVSAQVAYLFGVPLMTLDQQSKFLGYDFPEVDGFNANEHRMRLRYFFPKAQARIATSFFKVSYAARDEYPVMMIPPIIGQDVKDQITEPVNKQVTVYISAASSINQPIDDLLAIFSHFSDYTFHCFVEGIQTHEYPNVFIRPNTRAEFVDCLRQSAAVISTAGHNLITEALYFEVPMFLLPFNHYEQRLNAHVIEREQLGAAAPVLTADKLSTFFANLDTYRQKRRESAQIYTRFDGDEVFLALIEALVART